MSGFLDESVAVDDSESLGDESAEVIPETPDTSSFIVDSGSEDEESLQAVTKLKLNQVDLSSDDEEIVIPAISRKVRRPAIISDDEDEDTADHTTSLQVAVDEEAEEDRIERKIEKYAFSPKTRKSMGVRLSSGSESEDDDSTNATEDNSYETDPFQIPDGFSSTMVVPADNGKLNVSKSASIGSTDSSSVVLLGSMKEATIDISDESLGDKENKDTNPKEPQPERKRESTRKSLVQSKLTDYGKVMVPKEVYDEQLKKLEEMNAQISSQETLYHKVGKSMFDGGKKLLNKISELRLSVEEQRRSVEKLEVVQLDDSETKPVLTETKPINWDDLEGMLKNEVPRYVGKQGIKTFETQKAFTLDTLKEIHGSLSSCPPETAKVETPKYVKVELMEHQKHALAFMQWRESQRPKGGLLGDDMGLGKTLTMLSLMALDLERDHNSNEADASSDDNDDNDENEEAKAATKEKTKKAGGWSSRGRREHYDGGTLVVCPASLLQQWEGEVKSKLKRNALNYLVYHGTNRDSRGRYLSEYDLVITTYSIASVDKKTNIGLYRVKWNRIILDEGHAIRNHKSQMSVAACELMGRRRWLLTGTPIHNKEMDLFAVLKFLRCEPFNDLLYFKKWIDNKTDSGKQRLNTVLKSLMLRRTKAELQSKGQLQSLPEKRTIVIEVTLAKDEMNVYQRVMIYSRTLFAQFLHQRAEKAADQMALRGLADPSSVYYNLHKKMAHMNGNAEVKQFEILVLLLRLRQICCHPGLIDAMLDTAELSTGDASDEQRSELDLLNQLEKMTISDTSTEMGEARGATQKERILVSSNPVFSLTRPSSKIRKILEKIDELLQSPDKIVIVSQWSSVLDILETFTREKGIRTTKLTGKVNVKDRADVVEQFNKKDAGPRILFLSLTAGGVGLNLCGGNHLFLIDLHWNPQLEKQAQDRIYRFGQEKPVFIYKFMVVDTIEQRIKALQEHKLSIADAVLTGSKASAGSKLTIADLRSLFDMN